MSSILRELQNIEWSRACGPTNTLGGLAVQAERERARQQQRYEHTARQLERTGNFSVANEYIPSNAPTSSPVSTVGEAVWFILAGTGFFWLPCLLIVQFLLSATQISSDLAFGLSGWGSAAALIAIFTRTAIRQLMAVRASRRERPQGGERRPSGRLSLYHQDE